MRRLIPYLVVIAAMLGVPQATCAGDQFPHVLVTVAPLKPYVDTILHEAGTAQSLLRPGQDPHDFALSPSQAEMLDHVDILIVPDLSMNPLFAKVVAQKPKLKVIELSSLPGANPLPYAAQNPWIAAVKAAGKEKDDEDDAAKADTKPDAQADKPEEEKKAEQDAPKKHFTGKHPLPDRTVVDPHLWLDPERMAAIARPLADAIADSAPGYRTTLDHNADALAIHLRRDVMPAMQALLTNKPEHPALANKPEIPFITYHAAYQYFLGRFGIADQGQLMVRPEDYMGAKSLDTLLSAAKTTHIRCIIGEADTNLVKRIAAMSGAKIVILSPEQNVDQKDVAFQDWMQSDYDRLLYQTAKTFGDCL